VGPGLGTALVRGEQPHVIGIEIHRLGEVPRVDGLELLPHDGDVLLGHRPQLRRRARTRKSTWYWCTDRYWRRSASLRQEIAPSTSSCSSESSTPRRVIR